MLGTLDFIGLQHNRFPLSTALNNYNNNGLQVNVLSHRLIH